MKKLAGILLIAALLISAGCGVNNAADTAGISPQADIKAGAGGKVTFIELGSVKCIPCRMMQPIMDAIEKEYPDVNVVFYDVWTPDGQVHGRQYGVRVIPTQVFLDKEGLEYFRHEGFFAKEELEKILIQGGARKKEGTE